MTTAGQSEPTTLASKRRTPRLFTMVLALAAVLLVVDQLTKWWAVSELTGRAPINVLGRLLRLR